METDDRGYVYVVDRANTGLHILELTGEARTIAGVQLMPVVPDEREVSEPGTHLSRVLNGSRLSLRSAGDDKFSLPRR